MAFKCDQCDKEFNTEQGLQQHKNDKHGVSRHEKKELKKERQEERKHEISKKASSGKIKKYAVVAIIVVIIAAAGYYLATRPSGNSSGSDNILSTNLYSHSGVALHIHPNLEIEILGQKQTIPANIGISGSVMRVIHTHDSTGKLHVESPVPHTFVLKDFFTIWGRNFNSSCIFEYCTNETHSLQFFVNGQPNSLYGDLPLKDLDNIKIVYAQK